MTTTTENRQDRLSESHESLLETMQTMLDSQVPNFLRLYLNPWVAQTCVVLDRIARPLIHRRRQTHSQPPEPCPSFLANSREEALSGAIKLARFHLNQTCKQSNTAALARIFRSDRQCRSAVSGAALRDASQKQDLSLTGRSPVTLLVDPDHQFPFFGGWAVTPDHHLDFVPGILTSDGSDLDELLRAPHNIRIVVLAGSFADNSASQFGLTDEQRPQCGGTSSLRNLMNSPNVLVIRCCDVSTARRWAAAKDDVPEADIVVFDESFTDGVVPFAALTARTSLLKAWMAGAMSMFHSTTFQPNTISTMHFMKGVRRQFPEFTDQLSAVLHRLETEIEYRHVVYRSLFSPSLSGLIRTVGFDRAEPRAAGHWIELNSRRIFDGIAGVACSVRGHSPPTFCEDVRRRISQGMDDEAEVSMELDHRPETSASGLHRRLSRELAALTGLDNFVPAVSGGSAVEQALQIALTAQAASNRGTVVIMRGGFGGKTLGALTGTWKESYRKNVGPLYRDVVDIDPFASDTCDQLRRVVAEHRVAVVQLEPVQGVGGVRAIPQHVIQEVQSLREQSGFLILADEVQTGMYRTGPFLRSQDIGLKPDLVTIGKGTSDMMFPFAATLFNRRVARQMEDIGANPAAWFTDRFGYEVGYAAVLNTLRTATRDNWEAQVRRQGDLLQTLLTERLTELPHVKDVRAYGMLIGIELKDSFFRSFIGLNGRRLSKFYALQMLKAASNPLLIGFCQYEPHVFKLTPGLLISEQDLRQMAERICTSLRQSPMGVMADTATSLLRSYISR